MLFKGSNAASNSARQLPGLSSRTHRPITCLCINSLALTEPQKLNMIRRSSFLWVDVARRFSAHANLARSPFAQKGGDRCPILGTAYASHAASASRRDRVERALCRSVKGAEWQVSCTRRCPESGATRDTGPFVAWRCTARS